MTPEAPSMTPAKIFNSLNEFRARNASRNFFFEAESDLLTRATRVPLENSYTAAPNSSGRTGALVGRQAILDSAWTGIAQQGMHHAST